MKPQKLEGRVRILVGLTGLLLFLPALLPQTYPNTEEIRNLSNRRYLEETLRVIRSAKESIFLVMYHFPLDPSNKSSPVTRLAEALIEAKRRGVALQVILDQEVRADRSSQGAPMKNLRAYHFFKENGGLAGNRSAMIYLESLKGNRWFIE